MMSIHYQLGHSSFTTFFTLSIFCIVSRLISLPLSLFPLLLLFQYFSFLLIFPTIYTMLGT